MRTTEIQEDIDTFVTEVIDFINIENFEVLTGLGQSDEAFRVEVAAVEEVEFCQFCKVDKCKELMNNSSYIKIMYSIHYASTQRAVNIFLATTKISTTIIST